MFHMKTNKIYELMLVFFFSQWLSESRSNANCNQMVNMSFKRFVMLHNSLAKSNSLTTRTNLSKANSNIIQKL